MTVTFTPALGPIDHFVVLCLCCDVTHDVKFGTEEEAYDFVFSVEAGTARVSGCTDPYDDCADAASVSAREAVGEVPSTNVSNDSARHILPLLGLDATGELAGALPAEDVLGRALMALAVAPADEGIPAHEVPGTRATLVDCGRPAGYTEDRLRGIVEVAEWARDHDRQVQWA